MGRLTQALGKGTRAAAGAGAKMFGDINEQNLEMVRQKRLSEMGVVAEEAQYQKGQARKTAEMTDPNSPWSMQRKADVADFSAKEKSKIKTDPNAAAYKKAMTSLLTKKSDMMPEDFEAAKIEIGNLYGYGAVTTPGGATTTTGDPLRDAITKKNKPAAKEAAAGGTLPPEPSGGDTPGLLTQASEWVGQKATDWFGPDPAAPETKTPSKKTGRSARSAKVGAENREIRDLFAQAMVGSESKSVEDLEAIYADFKDDILEPDRIALLTLIKRKSGKKVGSGRSAR